MQVVTGAPYSGVEVRSTQQTLANGNQIQRQDQSKVFRDSQGRVRRETTLQTPDGQTRAMVMISDPVAGKIYELNPTNKVAYERPERFPAASQQGPRAARARTPAQSDPNVKSEALAAQSMNGVVASGSRITRTIPAGSIGNSQALQTVHETWIAEDLKVPVMTRTDDPRTGTHTMQLTNINRGEPDASLFQVPSDYTVKQRPAGPPPRRPGPPPPQQ